MHLFSLILPWKYCQAYVTVVADRSHRAIRNNCGYALHTMLAVSDLVLLTYFRKSKYYAHKTSLNICMILLDKGPKVSLTLLAHLSGRDTRSHKLFKPKEGRSPRNTSMNGHFGARLWTHSVSLPARCPFCSQMCHPRRHRSKCLQ